MEICGLVPAGGKATRLQPLPCSKELMPLGFMTLGNGEKRPKVISHYLLEKYQEAGANSTYFILRDGKWDIPAYYGDGKMLDMHLAYLMMNQPFGVPYTLDQAYPFTKGKQVLLGFPDIIFSPKDAFHQLINALNTSKSDVVVGLFDVDGPEQAMKCDMVDVDELGFLKEIIIKPKATSLTKSWIIAAWSPNFTAFMHKFLAEDVAERLVALDKKELFLGDVFIAAMAEGMKIASHYFSGHSYMDIGTPEELSKAYLQFSAL